MNVVGLSRVVMVWRGHEQVVFMWENLSSWQRAKVFASRIVVGLNDLTSRLSSGFRPERNVCKWKTGENPLARFESSSKSLTYAATEYAYSIRANMVW